MCDAAADDITVRNVSGGRLSSKEQELRSVVKQRDDELRSMRRQSDEQLEHVHHEHQLTVTKVHCLAALCLYCFRASFTNDS